ncbi:MAG: TonB-dependent receptor [Bacteroidales bacterium]|nr:TonB-dependent receptor [Bacteroidales bacterium]
MNNFNLRKMAVAAITLVFFSLLPLMAQETLIGHIRQMQENYGVHFIYDASLQGTLASTRTSSAPAATLPLEEALRQTFAGTNVNWQLRGNNVVLKAASAPVKARRFAVSGYITDAETGETLIGAGVLSGQTGAVTNEYGFYSLPLPAGRHQLHVAYIGYEQVTLELDLQRDTVLNFSLRNTAELDAARIVCRKDAGLQSVYLGSMEVPLVHICKTPSLFGEADLIKALQLLPGVQGGQEGLSGMYVRGGGPEENLVMIDGVSVYNMDHMLGLFSIFQPEAVKNVTLYKGAFPARYGGRISSIVDIRTNDGNMKETHGSLTIGVLNDRFHLEGPVIKDKLSYSLSTRGLHTIIAEPFLRLFLKKEYYNYYFYDLNGKMTWRAGDKDRLYLSLYHGTDRGGLDADEVNEYQDYTNHFKEHLGINWGSTVGALRWNHIFNGKLFSNTTLSFNRYRVRMDAGDDFEQTRSQREHFRSVMSASFRSGIRDFGFRTDFDWTPSPSHLVKFGAEFTRHDFLPEIAHYYEDNEVKEAAPYTGAHYTGNDTSIYAEDNISLGRHLTLNPGLRLSWFNTQGRNYYSLQPRFASRLSLDGGLAFKAGYSRMAQYVHLLSSSIIALPLDLWVPITKDIRPVTADHFSLGVYYDGLPGWEFSVEGYWKEMFNLLEYIEGVQFVYLSDGWETMVKTGRGRATGLEFLVQKTSGKTTGWISYSLSRSERWFPDGSINMGRPFPYKYDRPHTFNLTLNHKFSEKVDVSLSWVFSSGSMTTLAERPIVLMEPEKVKDPYSTSHVYKDDPNGRHSYYVESRNNYRLPPTHRLNLGVNLRHRTRRGNEAVWNFSIYNAYNAMNPNFILDKQRQEWDSMYNDYRVEREIQKLTILPIIPAFSYTYIF